MLEVLPFVLSLPHCAGETPSDLRRTMNLNDAEIADATDFGTREVFGDLPCAAVVRAAWSRLVVDLNRYWEETHEKGVIARVDYRGRPVFYPDSAPGPAEIRQRVAQYYQPYHKTLQKALERQDLLGLIDCHSMNGTGPREAPDAGQPRPDFVLGNNGDPTGHAWGSGPQGITCPPKTMKFLAQSLTAEGFSVSLNDPYPGGFITKYYGPALFEEGRFALQIEMNQDLVLIPGTQDLDMDCIARLREVFTKVLTGLRDLITA